MLNERQGLGYGGLMHGNLGLDAWWLGVGTGGRHRVCGMRDGGVGITPIDLLVNDFDWQRGGFTIVAVPYLRQNNETSAVF